MKNNRLIIVLFLLIGFFSSAQDVNLIKSTYLSNNGSGSSGNLPSSHTWNIPNAQNRLMIIMVNIERDHRPSPFSDNWVGNNGISDHIPNLIVGGKTILGTSSKYVNTGAWQNVSDRYNWSIVEHTNTMHVYTLSEAQGLPTGNTDFDFSNIKNPKSVADEISVTILVYENVSPSNPIQYINFGFNDLVDAGNSLLTISGPAASIPLGRAHADVLYVSLFGVSTELSDGEISASNWDQQFWTNEINDNGSALTNLSGYSEPDGLSTRVHHRNYTSGSPSISYTRSYNTSDKLQGAVGRIVALTPLAKPGISGTVYRDNNGLTGGIDGGGTGGGTYVSSTPNVLYVNVLNATGTTVVARTNVTSSGSFTIPAGTLAEGTTYVLQLSKTQGTVGQPAPAKELHTNWSTVGESSTGGASDGSPDGLLTVTLDDTNSTGNRFGVTEILCTPPTINTHPIDANYCQPATATALSVTATGASLSYQWYRNNANNTSGGTPVGTNSPSYTPLTNAANVGTFYYYVIVSSGTCTSTSNTAMVTVTAKPATPAVTSGSTLANSCPVATVNLTTLQPAAVSGRTYEWHNVATNPTAATKVGDATLVSVSGTYYLYAKTDTGGCFSNASNPVTVNITPCPTCTNPVIENQPETATYCQNTTATALSVTATGASLSYQWYRNTTNSITGATPVGDDFPTYTPIITATGILYYYVVITSGTCSTRSNFVAVNVNPTPAAPVASAATLINPCPIATADLTTLEPAAVTGISYEWHTVATNPTTGTKVANPSAVSVSGIYYLYSKADTGGCFSNASSAVTVTITSCTTCTSSGVTSVNLNSLYTGTLPTGVVLEWWTSPTRDLPPTPGTKVLDPLNVTVSGTYYVFFYDTINLCYNTDNSASAVTVNILPPCATCTNPGSTAVGGSPTKVGITVQKKQETWPESIKNGFIALQSQNKGMVITRVARVGGGTGGAPNLTTDSIKDPKEGMLVYDLAADCVKLFNGTIWKCLAKDCL